jgi:hypothetical protein
MKEYAMVIINAILEFIGAVISLILGLIGTILGLVFGLLGCILGCGCVITVLTLILIVAPIAVIGALIF